MKIKKKTVWMAGLFIALLMLSCTDKSKPVNVQTAAEAALHNAADVNINGQWYIESIVFDDSTYVRPNEVATTARQYFTFSDSTYAIMTNCNSFHGTMTISGNSIKLHDGMMTEIACEDMVTEEALRKILPCITTVDVENDSIVKLNSNRPAGYIVLSKAKIEIK